MKKPLLAILSIILLAQMIYANDEKSLPSQPENEYGIHPEALYRGEEVAEILRAVEEETTLAVEEAYDEGYKNGRIDGRDVWMPLYEDASKRAQKAERRPTFKDVLFWCATSFALGVTTAFFVMR